MRKIFKKPYSIFIIYLPFLILYCLFIIFKAESSISRDENTYLLYANNLIQGYYAPPGTTFLWTGPGYPIVLAIFEFINMPPLGEKILNGLFLYTSLIFIHKSFLFFIPRRNAMIISMAAGLYYPFFEMLPYRMTEPFVIFLISSIILLVNLLKNKPEKPLYKVLLVLSIGWLALTKIIFGYVLLFLILLAIITFAIYKKRAIRSYGLVCLFSLLITSPYLLYTYQKTGKIFYWGVSGGLSLYWMTSPYEGEYGDFINYLIKPSKNEQNNQLYRKRHEQVFENAIGDITFFERDNYKNLILKLDVKQDQYFKHRALQNIQNSPVKYIKNWIYNISRMLYNLPYSYKENIINWKYLLTNTLLLLLIFILVIKVTVKKIRLAEQDVFLLVLVVVYLSGSSLLSAYPRQFYITAPVWIFLTGKYLLQDGLHFNHEFKSKLPKH